MGREGFRFVTPSVPAGTRGSAAIEFDLGEGGEVPFNHFKEAFRFCRMLTTSGHDQMIALSAGRRRRRLAARADQKDFAIFPRLISEPDLVLAPDVGGLVVETPRLHDRERLRQHGDDAPEIEHTVVCGDRKNIARRDVA